MKLGEFRIIARKVNGTIHIAYKNKAGLLFTVTDIKSKWGFTFHLGKEFTQVSLIQESEKPTYLELVQPAREEKVKLKLVDKDAFRKFVETDYNGNTILK